MDGQAERRMEEKGSKGRGEKFPKGDYFNIIFISPSHPHMLGI